MNTILKSGNKKIIRADQDIANALKQGHVHKFLSNKKTSLKVSSVSSLLKMIQPENLIIV